MSNFTTHIATPPGGIDPALNVAAPAPLRQTVTMGPMKLGRKWGNRRRPVGQATQTASFRLDCEANPLDTNGEVVIRVGDYYFRTGDAILEQAADAESKSLNTAQTIAAAISLLPGFIATAAAGAVNTGDVSIVWTGFGPQVPFSVRQSGANTFISLITPADGLMAFGAVGPAAPQLT